MTVDEYLEAAPEPPAARWLSFGPACVKSSREPPKPCPTGSLQSRWRERQSPATHISRTTAATSRSVLSDLADELEPYEWSQGTLEFAVDKPLRHDLVARLVAVRMEQLGLR